MEAIEALPPWPGVPDSRRFVFESFWRLRKDAGSDILMVAGPMGGSVMRPIPRSITASAVHEWCDRHGMHGDEAGAFLKLIDAMDDAWRDVMAEQAPAQPTE